MKNDAFMGRKGRSIQNSTSRIDRGAAGLVVIDIQERLLPAICESERVLQNAVRLVQGARILNVPVLVTEQYRKGLGGTVPEIAGLLEDVAPFEKLAFSACGAEGFLDGLRARRISDVVLCGIEAHVCVVQSCLDLIQRGFRVFVVADAISSRTAENARIGLERMNAAQALIVSTEMVLFELLGRAGSEEFKRILPLVK